jgi:hypothetical protein
VSSIVRTLPILQPGRAEKLAQLPEQASDHIEPTGQPGWAFSRKTARQASQAGRTSARKSKSKGRSQRYHPATSDSLYSSDEVKLLKAVDAHRSATGQRFLSVTEILKIAERLGWHTSGRCACYHDTAIDVG